MIQAAYAWSLNSFNKCITIIASKTPLPVYTTPEQARAAILQGATTLYESESGDKTVVLAATGDMVFLPIFAAKEELEAAGFRVRIVAAANPRQLYRPSDVAWDSVPESDNGFMSDADFNALFDGDMLVVVSGGSSAPLEPMLIRSRATRRDVFSWKRGETTASPQELFELNGMTGGDIARRVKAAF
jgi:phosphoketolase